MFLALFGLSSTGGRHEDLFVNDSTQGPMYSIASAIRRGLFLTLLAWAFSLGALMRSVKIDDRAGAVVALVAFVLMAILAIVATAATLRVRARRPTVHADIVYEHVGACVFSQAELSFKRWIGDVFRQVAELARLLVSAFIATSLSAPAGLFRQLTVHDGFVLQAKIAGRFSRRQIPPPRRTSPGI